MFSTYNKSERRNLRGSARLSSKMSGKLPRLRALRPRQQRGKAATAETATHKSEGNLKEGTDKEIDANGRANNADGVEDDGLATEIIDAKANVRANKSSTKSSGANVLEMQNYECKTCKPPKTISNLKDYFEHLRKEHKHKVGY